MSENANEVSELISRLKDAEVLHYSVNQINEMISAAFEQGRRQGVAEGMERAAGIADGCELPMRDWAPGSFYATVRRDVGNCIRAAMAAIAERTENEGAK